MCCLFPFVPLRMNKVVGLELNSLLYSQVLVFEMDQDDEDEDVPLRKTRGNDYLASLHDASNFCRHVCVYK